MISTSFWPMAFIIASFSVGPPRCRRPDAYYFV
jgi:hypothetical protein